jgi:subtilase family serine protease
MYAQRVVYLERGETLKLKHITLFLSCIILLVLVGVADIAVSPRALASTAPGGPAGPSVATSYKPVCSASSIVHCEAYVLMNAHRKPLVQPRTSGPVSGSYGPAQFHVGYNLPCSVGEASQQTICAKPASFGGQTIAIVDAYNAPSIQADLNTYDSYYGLPACTIGNGCLKIVNENGQSASVPIRDDSWALEISLDVETSHEICQTCKILLVEASAANYLDLGKAVNTAASLGATEISNSYAGSDAAVETSYDSYYTHPGIAITASSGDSGYYDGYGVGYPAASPKVVAVGGTTLNLNSNNTYLSESVWGNGGMDAPGSGSGCSSYEKANGWQTSVADWSQTRCGSNRGIADISADADPYTGAAVYDSTSYKGQSGWFVVGGTSLASPLIAAVFALAKGTGSYTNAQQVAYVKFKSTNSHDVTTGSNGFCNGSIMCRAATGYDGPTGLGTPNGIGGF